MTSGGSFLYFAYGSNLLRERLRLQNPSAEFVSVGRLKDYVLRFGLWAEHVDNAWNGGVATVEESRGEEVWGIVWRLSNQHLATLDRQEQVYSPLQVTVDTDAGQLLCRTYRMNDFRPCLPSPHYKQVLCLGALQNGLPPDYRRKLESIETNKYSGPSSILEEIQLLMD
ncbi:gamma-glutamylcyclotransferase a [Denticeps clupeoides]|nr:gamma-glutamylcyclotransferase-like [Denticeps clupeoides]